jgi:hypothetical protein
MLEEENKRDASVQIVWIRIGILMKGVLLLFIHAIMLTVEKSIKRHRTLEPIYDGM